MTPIKTIFMFGASLVIGELLLGFTNIPFWFIALPTTLLPMIKYSITNYKSNKNANNNESNIS